MSLDYQDPQLGAPGGPQPPQPQVPPPSSPPGTQPPPPPVDLSQPAPTAATTPEPAAPLSQDGGGVPVQTADATDTMQQSLPQATPAGGGSIDDNIRILQDSLRPRQPNIPGKTPTVDAHGYPLDIDPNQAPFAAQPAQAIAPPDKGEPGFAGRAINRLLGTDIEGGVPYEWTRAGTTLAGGVGGAEVGASIPGPPAVKAAGAAVGSVVGTATGAIAPETTMDALEMMGILEPGTRDRLGLSDEQMKTLLLGEATLDVWFQGGAAAARMTGRGVVNMLTGANATSKGLAETATREGISLMPVQVGEGSFARGYASIFGRLPVAAGPIKAGATQSLNQITTMFEDIPQRLGPLASQDEVSARIMRDGHNMVDGIARVFDQRSAQLMQQADFMKVAVSPVATRATTDNLMKQIAAEQPKGIAGKVADLTPGSKDLRAWMSKNTRALTDIDPATGQSGTELARLPLRQMDTLIQNIDQKMAQWAEKDPKTMQRFQQLRNSVQADMVNNAMVPNAAQPGRFTSTPQSRALMDNFRAMDEDLTYTMNQFFQSTTARRLGITTSVTGRAASMADMGTKGFDKMGDVILRGDNPAAIADLQRLTTPDTMRRLGNSVFNQALNDAYVEVGKGGVRRFDGEKFSKALGLDAPTSGKYAQTQALLNATGGVTMPQLQQFVEIARRAGDVDVPNVSSFLVRRVTMGGDLMKAFPGAIAFSALAGGGEVAGGHLGALAMGLATMGGARLISSMISNPLSARALGRVMDQEVVGAAKTAAYVRATSYAIENMVRDHVITAPQGEVLGYNFRVFAKQAELQAKRNAP